MTIEQAPRRKVAPTLLSALLALAVAAWVNPAHSATGADARCDQANDGLPMSVRDDDRMTLHVLGHAEQAGAENVALAEPQTEPAALPGASRVESRVDALLRRTARQAASRRSQPAEPGDKGVPVVADKAEALDETPAGLDAEQTEAAAEHPAYPDDDLVRYLQRQMYRTDI